MKQILEDYEEQLKTIAINKFSVKNIHKIRINMSAVYECVIGEEEYILKFLISSNEDWAQSESDYFTIHANQMLMLGQQAESPFARIFHSTNFLIDGINFLILVEEKFSNTFEEGIIKIFNENNRDAVKTSEIFLIELLKLYIHGEKIGFIAHRDLSFDNLMFDDRNNIRMIDSGSAKTTSGETTIFSKAAPTKAFYSAPEYFDAHHSSRNNEDLVKLEIYTLGILTLSLMNCLYKNSECNEIQCGIILWLKENNKTFNPGESLKEAHKTTYLSYLLVELFDGDVDNIFFLVLGWMVEHSVSARMSNYKEILNRLGEGI